MCAPALVLLFAVQASQGPSPAQLRTSQEHQNERAPAQRKAEGDQQPSGAISTAPPQALREAPLWVQPTLGQEREREPATNGWAIAATALNLLLTGLLLCLMYRQWRAMEAQADYMRDGLTETRRANETTERAVKIAERAYLGVIGCAVSNLAIGERPRCTVTITNTGRTPAKIIYSTTRVVIDRGSEHLWIPEHRQAFLHAEYPDILPGVPRSIEGELEEVEGEVESILRADVMAELEADETRLHVTGKMTYRDIFGDVRDLPYRYTYNIAERRFTLIFMGWLNGIDIPRAEEEHPT